LYTPNRDELARQQFVLSLKLLANGRAQQRVRDSYRADVLPTIISSQGAEPTHRREVSTPLSQRNEFKLWAVLTHHSQTMMWDAIERTVARVLPDVEHRYAALQSSDTRVGSLTLNPQLAVPPPIGNTEIHRQPGGFVGRYDVEDVAPGLRYFGASAIYAVGKGQKNATGDGRAAPLLNQLQERFGSFSPRRILDLGCGIGVHSQAIARAFPQAEYHGVDVAAGLLRVGHLMAEERGVPIHFHQQDAAKTSFEAGSFDLVLSNILFHETNSARLPQILRECRRLLRPGGVMLHLDVPTQVSRLGFDDQVMNDWQVRWNGEPFWTGFAERDMLEEIVAAGFERQHSFATHVSALGSTVYVFGASA
jgi:SAM-dependent methyltransferase